MEIILFAIITVLIIVALANLKIKKARKAPARKPLNLLSQQEIPYTRNRFLFSVAEKSFLGILDLAVGDKYRIMGKVRVADVVNIKKLGSRQEWQTAFNPIKAKHFDFLLCDKNNLSIIAAVELDDKSHQDRTRRKRDEFLSQLCEAVGLPLIRVPARGTYSVPEIRRIITEKIDGEKAAA